MCICTVTMVTDTNNMLADWPDNPGHSVRTNVIGFLSVYCYYDITSLKSGKFGHTSWLQTGHPDWGVTLDCEPIAGLTPRNTDTLENSNFISITLYLTCLCEGSFMLLYMFKWCSTHMQHVIHPESDSYQTRFEYFQELTRVFNAYCTVHVSFTHKYHVHDAWQRVYHVESVSAEYACTGAWVHMYLLLLLWLGEFCWKFQTVWLEPKFHLKNNNKIIKCKSFVKKISQVYKIMVL